MPTLPLEPDRETRESWIATLSRVGLDHVDAAAVEPTAPLLGPEGNARAAEVSRAIPEDPIPGGIGAVAEILRRAAPAGVPTTHPGYFAYIPGGGLFCGPLADLVAGQLNRYTGIAAAAPAFARLEADVLRWLATQFGYPAGARGVLTSGGSTANFAAIVAARQAHLGDRADLRRATVYTSNQVHHSVAKSVRLAGIPVANVRAVPTDSRFRMDVAALTRAIARDRNGGQDPFLVVSSAGTTNTGAVDPLADVQTCCEQEGLWHHVDGAYGGAFVLCDEGRRRLQGIDRADSIAFDPHKGMFLPYGTGCLLVRQGSQLRAAHDMGATYLQDLTVDEAIPSPADYGPELSRDFRGLRPWLALMLHGARAFRVALAEKLELANRFHAQLVAAIDAGLPVEIVDAPQLSTVTFRLVRADREPLPAWNRRNGAFLTRINRRGRAYLSSTTLPVEDGDAYTLRVCVLSYRTHAAAVVACLDDVIDAAGETA